MSHKSAFGNQTRSGGEHRRHEQQPLSVRVECYAGYRGEETPVRFWLGENLVEVKEVVDCWLAPDHRYFKVRTAEGDTYILRNDIRSSEWELTLFERGTDRQARSAEAFLSHGTGVREALASRSLH